MRNKYASFPAWKRHTSLGPVQPARTEGIWYSRLWNWGTSAFRWSRVSWHGDGAEGGGVFYGSNLLPWTIEAGAGARLRFILFYFIFSPFSLKNRLACEFCIDQSEREWVKWGKEKEKKKEETKRAGDDVAGSIIGGSRAAHCASDGQGPPWNRAGAVVSDETLSFRNWPSGRQTTGQTNKQQRLVVRIRNQ